MPNADVIASALHGVLANMRELEVRHGRPPGSVQLLAVSKTKSIESVRAAIAAGQRSFGENQLQDAMPKVGALERGTLKWHFIGPLQSNKTRPVAEHFDWLQSLDRIKIAHRLDEQRPPHLAPLNVCIQVNIGGEVSKAGVAPDQVANLAEQIAALPRLALRGLMAIPKPEPGFERQRQGHRELKALFDALCNAGHNLDTVSVGMSGDLEAAIAEGSTMVRVGTAIFGAREPGNKGGG